MNKLKSKLRLLTQIADIPAEGATLLDERHLRLVVGARAGAGTAGPGGAGVGGGTCAPGVTYPASYVNPGEIDTVTDDVYD